MEDAAFLSEVADVSGKYSELVELWEKEIELLQNNKVTKTTTLADLYAVYPDVAEDLEDDMDEFNWTKDMGLAEK
jgi:hypothetical protein